MTLTLLFLFLLFAMHSYLEKKKICSANCAVEEKKRVSFFCFLLFDASRYDDEDIDVIDRFAFLH